MNMHAYMSVFVRAGARRDQRHWNPWSGATGIYKSLVWESILGFLQELLTTEVSLQLQNF